MKNSSEIILVPDALEQLDVDQEKKDNKNLHCARLPIDRRIYSHNDACQALVPLCE